MINFITRFRQYLPIKLTQNISNQLQNNLVIPTSKFKYNKNQLHQNITQYKNHCIWLQSVNSSNFCTINKILKFDKIPLKIDNDSQIFLELLFQIECLKQFKEKNSLILSLFQNILIYEQRKKKYLFFQSCLKYYESNISSVGQKSLFNQYFPEGYCQKQQINILLLKFIGILYKEIVSQPTRQNVSKMEKIIKISEYQALLQNYFNCFDQEVKVNQILAIIDQDQTNGMMKESFQRKLTKNSFAIDLKLFKNCLLKGHQYAYLHNQQIYAKVKKDHLKVVSNFLKVYFNDKPNKSQLLNLLRWNHLFPINMFNVTDLPVILELLNLYLYPCLKSHNQKNYLLHQQLIFIQENVQMMKRFIQCPIFYLKTMSQQINRMVKDNKIIRCQDMLRLINIIYLVLNQITIQYIEDYWDAINIIKKAALKLIHQNFVQLQNGVIPVNCYFTNLQIQMQGPSNILLQFRYLIVNYQCEKTEDVNNLNQLINQLSGQKMAVFLKRYLGFADIFEILMKLKKQFQLKYEKTCFNQYQLQFYQQKVNNFIGDVENIAKQLTDKNQGKKFYNSKYEKHTNQEMISLLLNRKQSHNQTNGSYNQTNSMISISQNCLNTNLEICQMLSQNSQFLSYTISQNHLQYLKQLISNIFGFQDFGLNWNYPFRCDIGVTKTMSSSQNKQKQYLAIYFHFNEEGLIGKGNCTNNVILNVDKNNCFDSHKYTKVTHKKYVYACFSKKVKLDLYNWLKQR